MPGPPDLRVELQHKAVGAPPAPSPPSPPPSAPPSPKTPRLAAALAPYVGAWKVVWLISPASMREFLEERASASRRARHGGATQSSELEFGVDGMDNWTERDLMSLNLFHTNRVVIPINGDSSEGVTPTECGAAVLAHVRAMVLGSFIAGSTPLGGGVVGFPVAVLVLRMEPAQGRDFSAMIQAAGMTSASYLILYLKPELVHVKLVSWSIAFGVLGCIVGFVVEVDPFAVNLALTTHLLAFAVVYFYKNEIIEHYLPPLGCAKGPAPGGAKGDALAELVRAEEARTN
ncbi:membrane transporter protein [Aureococcus anophagefferens]|uniref:Membrane transporter protein n=1 Tax=Aureococcus anophagefferens TaxID=44056 RepID=A0ABR1FPR6_AURAN